MDEFFYLQYSIHVYFMRKQDIDQHLIIVNRLPDIRHRLPVILPAHKMNDSAIFGDAFRCDKNYIDIFANCIGCIEIQRSSRLNAKELKRLMKLVFIKCKTIIFNRRHFFNAGIHEVIIELFDQGIVFDIIQPVLLSTILKKPADLLLPDIKSNRDNYFNLKFMIIFKYNID